VLNYLEHKLNQIVDLGCELGVATYLISCCENWAKEKGCIEFASDCDISNLLSRAMHENNGFTEVSNLVHYIKKLD
jgi:aminoglycoside 6'-N-acetyltransferase I